MKKKKILFQFYLSSIKSQARERHFSISSGFNSTLVQLKAEMPNQVPETFQSFNSTLVQLKAGSHV